MSRTHSAGSRKSSTCQSATHIVFRIAVVAGKMRTSQTENSFHLGRRYVDGQQFSSEPQINGAPVGLGKALPNVPALHPALIDRDGSLGSNRGLWVAYTGEVVGSQPRCSRSLPGHPLRGRMQQVLGGARENRTGFDNLYPRSVTADRTSRELLVGEASQSSQVTPVAAGQIAAISVSQLFADGRCQGRFQRCGADANPSLEMARAGLEHHAGLMTISAHEFKDPRWGVIEVEENIAGIAILGIGEQIYVVTLAVACAQKAHHGSTHQLTRIPKPFSRTHSACGMVNQPNEVEFIRHSRQLAADSVQGKEKSAVEHGSKNAIEAPRRYNDFQRTATTPLTLCLSPRVHSTIPTLGMHALPPFPCTPSPKAQIFTDRLRSHCCGIYSPKSLGLSNCKGLGQSRKYEGRPAGKAPALATSCATIAGSLDRGAMPFRPSRMGGAGILSLGSSELADGHEMQGPRAVIKGGGRCRRKTIRHAFAPSGL